MDLPKNQKIIFLNFAASIGLKYRPDSVLKPQEKLLKYWWLYVFIDVMGDFYRIFGSFLQLEITKIAKFRVKNEFSARSRAYKLVSWWRRVVLVSWGLRRLAVLIVFPVDEAIYDFLIFGGDFLKIAHCATAPKSG